MRMTACLLTLALAVPAAAQQIAFSPEATESCLAAQDGASGAGCVGKSAAVCIAAMRGASDEDAAMCLNAETEWWRQRMRAAYARVEKKAALLDVEFAQSIAQGGARMTDDLAAMQSAWTDWSEKRCFFAAIEHRGKPDRTRVASDCMLHQTGDQALLLEAVAARRKISR